MASDVLPWRYAFQYDKPAEMLVPEPLRCLQDNLDVTINMAERHYYNCDFRQCYDLTKK